MGSSEPETKQIVADEEIQTSSTMETRHESGNRDGLAIEVDTNSGEDSDVALVKTLSSSSSSSSSSSGSPFELDITNSSRLSSSEIASLNNDSDSQLASETEESSTQSPPIQMMELNTPSGYRIPSSVFARNKSSAPAEWSVASNESLFSIHMGNMSFTRDHVNWFKSGELGLPGDPIMPPTIDYSSNHQYLMSNQPPTNKPPELLGQHVGFDVDFRVTESKAAETMREVIKENEVDHANKEKEKDKDKDKDKEIEKSLAKRSRRSASFRRSDASGASVKSFAFPILTGDHKGNSSQKTETSPQQTPKVAHKQELQQKSQQEITKPETNASNLRRWFSCFPCCSSCS